MLRKTIRLWPSIRRSLKKVTLKETELKRASPHSGIANYFLITTR